jgi:hypothetical protein
LSHFLNVIQSPVVSIVLAVVLLFDVLTLGEDSTVGCWINPPPRRCGGWWPMADIVQRPGGIALVPEEQSRAIDQNNWIATLSWNEHWHQGGWWRPTKRWNHAIRIVDSSRPLTTAEERQFRQMFVANLRAHHDPDFDNLLEGLHSDPEPTVQIFWAGYVLDAFSAMCATCLTLSFGWIPKRIAAARRGQAMRQGLCPECRYDLHNQVNAGCPECGWRREQHPVVVPEAGA